VILRAECGPGATSSVSRHRRAEKRRSSAALSLSLSDEGAEGAIRFGESSRSSQRTTRVFAGSPNGGCR
jgi:hypothetical protein